MKFAVPDEVASAVAQLMEGFGARWCVAGGWALDLFLGRATRPHSDVELAVLREDQWRLHGHLDGWSFTASVRGRREAWRPGELLELPVHEIHAYSPDQPPRSIELLLNERDGTNWVFRRDAAVVLPLCRAFVTSPFGVPVLSPEIVLLYKSKSPRPKDETDLHTGTAAMSAAQRQWLRSALLGSDSSHPWVPVLDAAADAEGDGTGT